MLNKSYRKIKQIELVSELTGTRRCRISAKGSRYNEIGNTVRLRLCSNQSEKGNQGSTCELTEATDRHRQAGCDLDHEARFIKKRTGSLKEWGSDIHQGKDRGSEVLRGLRIGDPLSDWGTWVGHMGEWKQSESCTVFTSPYIPNSVLSLWTTPPPARVYWNANTDGVYRSQNGPSCRRVNWCSYEMAIASSGHSLRSHRRMHSHSPTIPALHPPAV